MTARTVAKTTAPKLKTSLAHNAGRKVMDIKMIKKIALIVSALTLTAAMTACNGANSKAPATPTPVPTLKPELTEGKINATITLESGDEIELELYPNVAPETVENFVELAEDGFYDGTIFHRVIEDFMIQGGGYDENLKEQKTGTITGEFEDNGFDNPLSHSRGVISMARTAVSMDSASSQFFIVQQYSPHLDGKYAAFGMVVDGMDVVDDIAAAKTGTVASAGMENVPINPIIIESITIDGAAPSKSKSAKPSAAPSASSKPSSSKDTDNMLDEDVIKSIMDANSNSAS